MATLTIREKLYNFIRVADDKKIKAIYELLEGEIDKNIEWWNDPAITKELDNGLHDLETGKDKGLSLAELSSSIDDLRKKHYGK